MVCYKGVYRELTWVSKNYGYPLPGSRLEHLLSRLFSESHILNIGNSNARFRLTAKQWRFWSFCCCDSFRFTISGYNGFEVRVAGCANSAQRVFLKGSPMTLNPGLQRYLEMGLS